MRAEHAIQLRDLRRRVRDHLETAIRVHRKGVQATTPEEAICAEDVRLWELLTAGEHDGSETA